MGKERLFYGKVTLGKSEAGHSGQYDPGPSDDFHPYPGHRILLFYNLTGIQHNRHHKTDRRGSGLFQLFIYLSQKVVNENNRTPDAMLYLNQAGFTWHIGPVKWDFAGSYYSRSNLNGTKWMHDGAYNKGGGNSFVTDPAGNITYEYGYKLWEAFSQIAFELDTIL